MNSTHHLGQTRRVAANCYDHKSTGHRLRHVPNFMSQIGPRDRLYVSTRTRFVSHGDVSPLAMVRGVTTFMSATTVVWDIKFVKTDTKFVTLRHKVCQGNHPALGSRR
jgi:hypothetical protein